MTPIMPDTESRALNIIGYVLTIVQSLMLTFFTALSILALRTIKLDHPVSIFLFVAVGATCAFLAFKTLWAINDVRIYWKHPDAPELLDTEIGIEDYKPALKKRYADIKRQLYNCAALMRDEGFTKKDWDEAREMAKAARRGEEL